MSYLYGNRTSTSAVYLQFILYLVRFCSSKSCKSTSTRSILLYIRTSVPYRSSHQSIVEPPESKLVNQECHGMPACVVYINPLMYNTRVLTKSQYPQYPNVLVQYPAVACQRLRCRGRRCQVLHVLHSRGSITSIRIRYTNTSAHMCTRRTESYSYGVTARLQARWSCNNNARTREQCNTRVTIMQ